MLLISLSVAAQDVRTLWTSAAQKYSDGDYQGAVDDYLLVANSGHVSPELFFNLGNAYLKSGEVARAILNFERAQRLDPGDQDIRHNLAVARGYIDNPIIPVEQFFLLRWVKAASTSLSPMGWGALFLVFLWIFVLLLTGRIRVSGLRRRRWLTVLSGVIVMVALLLGTIAAQLRKDKQSAILMIPSQLLIAPDSTSKPLRMLNPGEKVKVIDSLDGYYKVRLMNYEDGWLQAGLIERI